MENITWFCSGEWGSVKVEESEGSLRGFADMMKVLTKRGGIRMERKERPENYLGGLGVIIQTS